MPRGGLPLRIGRISPRGQGGALCVNTSSPAAAAAGLAALSVPAARGGNRVASRRPRVSSRRRPPAARRTCRRRPVPTQQVRQLAQCGGTMYAVGSFTSIKQGQHQRTPGTTPVSFSATYARTRSRPGHPWRSRERASSTPSPSAAATAPTPTSAGAFTSVSGTGGERTSPRSAPRPATVVSGFGHSANGAVGDPGRQSAGHLLAGGTFTSINGGPRSRAWSA